MSSSSTSRRPNSFFSADVCAQALGAEGYATATIVFTPIFLAAVLALTLYSIIKRPKYSIFRGRKDVWAIASFALLLTLSLVISALDIPSFVLPFCANRLNSDFVRNFNLALQIFSVLIRILTGFLSYRVARPHLQRYAVLRGLFIAFLVIFTIVAIADLGVYSRYNWELKRYLDAIDGQGISSSSARRLRPRISALTVTSLSLASVALYGIYSLVLGCVVLARRSVVKGSYSTFVVFALWLQFLSYLVAVIRLFIAIFADEYEDGVLYATVALYLINVALNVTALWLFGHLGTLKEYGGEKNLSDI